MYSLSHHLFETFIKTSNELDFTNAILLGQTRISRTLIWSVISDGLVATRTPVYIVYTSFG